MSRIPKTGELIARELRRRIVRGDLPAGSFLPSEAELMAQLSVSRASLREALRILESESLLTVKRGSRGGPVVHQPDPGMAAHYFGLVLQANDTTLEDVHMARMLIELPALRIVVDSARGKAPPLLQQILASARAAVQRDDGRAFARDTMRFHNALIELTGNNTLVLVMRMLNTVYEQHIAVIDQAGPDFDRIATARSGLKAQERLLELIAQGDIDGATNHWRAHLRKIRNLLFGKHAVDRLIDIV